MKIVFEFRDKHTHGQWIKRECVMRSVRECIVWYGLEEPGVEYRNLYVVNDID